MFEIIGQILGILAVAFGFASYQMKTLYLVDHRTFGRCHKFGAV